MTRTRLLTTLIDLISPTSCAGCERPGMALCRACERELTAVRSVRRATMATGPPIYALGDYRGAARRAVLNYKEHGRRDVATALAAGMADALPWLPGARPDRYGTWWLVPAPSRAAAVRKRGDDHLLRLARQVAAALAARGSRAAVAPGLRLAVGTRDSVGLDYEQRAVNLAGRVRTRVAGLPEPDTPVVLLDDVVTTGTTAAACTAALVGHELRVTAVLALTATQG